ncbi:hypothetical protein DFR76_102273 [Nocardia pseudobrasiliensis]|uniref:Integral membrane protein n=2 Tax=Nocardia pseudobrasiliensis TaxID=45979 RepID=A0A370IAX3_9NOCA|nr:hypothetical protein [Nocardia pseudobrasiliensis]RDI67873.1 hypothetical protein DFR76_102273 [Nocardia pseudobrasiliensis]
MTDTSVIAARRVLAHRADFACAGAAVVLVGTAIAVPRILGEQWSRRLYAGAAPLFGQWLPHAGWGTIPAIAIAALVIAYGPALARQLPWRRLLALTWLTAVCWAFALAMVDGWRRGFTDRLTTRDEYLHEVGGVTDIAAMLRGFSARILDFQPDSWTTHVSGHPPGALLSFVLLDRLGLGGGAWAAWLCTIVGCGAAVAVPVTLRALGAEERARAATPFLALAPAAIWLAVSGDALFAGVTAWAVALLAVALRMEKGWLAAGLGSGALFGFGIYLSYGLVLMVIPAAAVLALGLLRRMDTPDIRPALAVAVGALLVVGLFTAAGFWWFDGYHLVVQRYYQGIASERPYSYWVWADLAAAACALGPAAAAALHRVVREVARPFAAGLPALRRGWRPWVAGLDPAAVLAAAGVAAILAADLSGLSKAETERIWLPFDVWVLAGTALLPGRGARFWLTVQAATALLLNHIVLTNW